MKKKRVKIIRIKAEEEEEEMFYCYLQDEWAVIRYITCYPKWNHINPVKFLTR